MRAIETLKGLFASADVQPESLEERVIWHSLLFTYAYYAVGALYVLGPVIGWYLAVKVARRTGLAGLPSSIWVWVAGMLVMQLALMMAYQDFNLGLGAMIKSSIGWAKGWALLPVFMIIGFGQVRIELLARASALIGLQTLIILPLAAVAWVIHLPGHLFVSPISIIGGPGPEYFAVELYGISPDSGAPRWRLFAPWAPAIGLVMCVHFLLALNEKNALLRNLGMAGMLLSILGSSSRLGLLVLPPTLAFGWLLRNLGNPRLYFVASPLALLAGIVADPIKNTVEEVMHRFHGARADSSRVRATLGRMAVDRWGQDGTLWGHGAVEPGPHLVEHMPIGSHHTWFGLLFVKGTAGAVALAVPMLWSLVALARSPRDTPAVRTGMAVLMLLFFYTFAENLEILAYLYWPGLVVMGMAFKQAAFPPEPAETGPAQAPGAQAMPSPRPHSTHELGATP